MSVPFPFHRQAIIRRRIADLRRPPEHPLSRHKTPPGQTTCYRVGIKYQGGGTTATTTSRRQEEEANRNGPAAAHLIPPPHPCVGWLVSRRWPATRAAGHRRHRRRSVLLDVHHVVLLHGASWRLGSRPPLLKEEARGLGDGIGRWARFPAQFAYRLVVVHRQHDVHEPHGERSESSISVSHPCQECRERTEHGHRLDGHP
jgi:hypothetical protein